MALVRRALGKAAVVRLATPHVCHERVHVDIVDPRRAVPREQSVVAPQHPPDHGCDIAVPHVRAAGNHACLSGRRRGVGHVGQELAETAVGALQLPQPLQRGIAVDAGECVFSL